MQGQAFLVTFFATEKSDSPSRAKPEMSAHSAIGPALITDHPKQKMPISCDTGIFHNHYNVKNNQLNAANTLAVISSTEPTPSIRLYFGVPSAAARFW